MAGAAVKLSVRLLGPIEVLVDGKVVEVPGRRPRALLAVLALSAGEAVPAEALYERVWGHDQPGDVRANLYTCVRRLRKVLGEDAIRNDGGRYALCVAPDDVDAVRFTRLLDRARAVGADPERLRREALDLWRGRPFGDEPLSDWLTEAESRRLTERWLAAVQQRIDLDLAAGRSESLLEELEQLTMAYPLREPLWVRYLQALDRAGRPADALAAYERVRLRLVDELGIDPSPQLQDLYAVLLRGESPVTQARTVEVPRQLPSDVAAFTGRDDALADLDRLLAGSGEDGEPRPATIITLHGLGGIGKTTLGVHWAYRIADRFPDGQLFVNLRGYGPGEPMDAAAALDVLLRGLGVPGDQIPAGTDARSGMWRSRVAGKRLLLLLDNARDADQVRPLLPGASSLVLITSRTNLRGLAAREGARSIRLDALPEADAIALLRSRLGRIAGDTEALAELASLCGCLPLALTVAAERVHRQLSLALGDLVAELRDEQDRLDSFADPDDALSDVRAVLSWSYRSVGADAGRVLCLLTLAPTVDVGLDAIAALAGIGRPAARRLVQRLADASLVTATPGGRYELHDLVRAYAAEQARVQLAAEDQDGALDRLYYWCLGTVTSAGLAVKPVMSVLHPEVDVPGISPIDFAGDRSRAMTWVNDEVEFLGAVARAAAPSHPWVVIGIAHAAWDSTRLSRPLSDLAALQQLAVDAARAIGHGRAETRALNVLGLVRHDAGENLAAIEAFGQALDLSERLNDLSHLSHVVNNLGLVELSLGRPAEAERYHRRALEACLRRDADEAAIRMAEANVRNNLAIDFTAMSQHDRAVAEARRSLEIYRAFGPPMEQAKALDTLGTTLHGQGDYAGALECFTEALAICREPFISQPVVMVTANIARTQYAAGRHREAAASFQDAIALIDQHQVTDSDELNRAELVELLGKATRVDGARTQS